MINDEEKLEVKEEVVLQKFEGEALPENEFERLTVLNGEVVSHNRIENGEIAGPVEEGNLTGTDIGRLLSEN
jgi:hypothetical protein